MQVFKTGVGVQALVRTCVLEVSERERERGGGGGAGGEEEQEKGREYDYVCTRARPCG